MKFFSLGVGELLMILLFAIIAIGPKETLRLAGQAREVVNTVRSAFSEFTSEITDIAADVTEISDDAN